MSTSHIRRKKTVERNLTNYFKPGLKGRSQLKHLSKEHVELAMSRMTGNQALKFLHPRKLRNAIINKQVPNGVFKPQE